MNQLICASSGCDETILRKPGSGRPPKLCPAHRLLKKRMQMDSPTLVCARCDRPVRAKGLCNTHYKQVLRDEGRIAPYVRTEKKKDADQRRRARMLGAGTGGSVFLSQILERDGNSCGLCHEPVDMTLSYPDPFSKSVDHVIPLSRGGSHSPENCQLAHLRCNHSKGAKVA